MAVSAKSRTRIEHTIRVGGRKYTLRSNDAFFPVLNQETLLATGPQMRILAHGSYTLLVDKILAGDPQGFPTILRVSDLPYYDAKYKGYWPRYPLKMKRLSEAYVQDKARGELDPRPLIATGFYLTHIEVKEEVKPTGLLYSVYVPDIVHEPSGLPLKTIVGWLEYGTATMPKRPHWRPVALIIRQKWEKLPVGIKAIALRKALRRLR
jgi:hypothetical protein